MIEMKAALSSIFASSASACTKRAAAARGRYAALTTTTLRTSPPSSPACIRSSNIQNSYSHHHRHHQHPATIVSASLPSQRIMTTTIRCMGNWPKLRPKRVRVITCDVTGTLVSFRGSLEQHYLGAARKSGVDLGGGSNGDEENLKKDVPIAKAFNKAYKEMSHRYPCFGGSEISAKGWWKLTVLRSFELAGVDYMTPQQQELVFQRVYSTFGSLAAYELFDDALPFLNFAVKNHVICGVVSNADERYGDSILPMLGVTFDVLNFACFSKDYGLEKPDARIFMSALKEAEGWIFNTEDPLLPGHCLHIGNDYAKDFEAARRVGMHAVLLNRYGEEELAQEWKRRGAIVFDDLMDVVWWLGQSDCQLG